MKKFLIVVLFTSLAWAAQPTAPVDLITENSIKSDMFFLANDDMKGRDATSPEDRITADYVASEFMRLGLKPVGDDGTYFQDFDMVVGPLDRAHTIMRANLDGTEKTFQMGHDFTYFFVQSANPTAVTAPLVFAGYGVNAPEYKYNDYAGIDVHGKVVLVLDREPQPNDPNSRFKGGWDTVHSYMWYKIAQAQKAGAAGLLVLPDRTRRKMLKRLVPTNGEAGPSPQFALAGNFLDIPVFMITGEVANELLAPSGKTLSQARQAIDSTGEPASFAIPGVSVSMRKNFLTEGVRHTRNVVGLLEGRDPQLKEQVIVVSGHFDHVGVVGGRIYRGADDNASGTIGMLEIAKAFVNGGVKPKRSILFCAWEAEERGLLGAFYYVDHPIIPLDKTVANLNMDMIGRNELSANWPTPPDQNDNMVNVVGTPYDPQIKTIVDNENKQVGLRLDYKTDIVDPESWFARSDHFCFAIHGVPMVLFNTGEHPDYHTELDTWDRINYPKMTKIVRLIFLTAQQLASNGQKIEFTP